MGDVPISYSDLGWAFNHSEPSTCELRSFHEQALCLGLGVAVSLRQLFSE
jgi:hypothetical protein